jgi:tRNA (guanosine-2'-O-)-methyltransferase
MNIERYRAKNFNNTGHCFDHLRSRGYRIMVADPSEDGTSIDEIDASAGKIALVFGNELNGASAHALENADEKIRIPMYGFTESLNISVSVAICLNTILRKLRQSSQDISLSLTEKEKIKLAWYRKIVKRSDVLEREFLRTIE